MHILITGGAGFIGSTTALQLVALGHEVTVLDNFLPQVHGTMIEESPTWKRIAGKVRLYRGDIRDREMVRQSLDKTEAVLHLAAETGTGQSMYEIARYTDVNIMGTAILLEEIQLRRNQVKRLVVASSRSIYGEGRYHCETHGDVFPEGRRAHDMTSGHFEPRCPKCDGFTAKKPTREDSLLNPQSIYAATKLAQENMVIIAAKANGMSCFALRYQNVYGPGQSLSNPYTGILSIFSREFLAGRPVEIFEDGLESRDFIHVDDIANVNVLALTHPTDKCAAVNIGSGKAISVNDVASMLQNNYGTTSVCTKSGRFRAGDIRHNFADISRLQKLFSYVPQVDFETGLAQFCHWARPELAGSGESTGYQQSLQELTKRKLL